MRRVIYDTYANFPTGGVELEDLAWATDRKCLYRWNGSAWIPIGISSRHGNYEDIGDPANYPESSLYQADDKTILYMVVNAAWQPVTFQGLPPWQVGDIIVMSADTERSGSSTNWLKKKEIQIASGGIIRVSFDLKANLGGTAYGRIYKNDEAYGTERTDTTQNWHTFTEDLEFETSDTIQLWGKTSNGSYEYRVRNFQLKADRRHIHTLNLD